MKIPMVYSPAPKDFVIRGEVAVICWFDDETESFDVEDVPDTLKEMADRWMKHKRKQESI